MSDQVKSDFGIELVSVDQLAVLLHKSPASIRSDASRNPLTLPPICRLPGNKRLLWRKEDVSDWFAKFVVQPVSVVPPVAVGSEIKRRGRPRKVAR
jgi:hypothetical protein